MVGDKLPGTKEEQGMHSTAIELTSPLFRWVSCARGTPARRGIPAPPTCGNPGKESHALTLLHVLEGSGRETICRRGKTGF